MCDEFCDENEQLCQLENDSPVCVSLKTVSEGSGSGFQNENK